MNCPQRMCPQEASKLTTHLRREFTHRLAASLPMPAGVRRVPGVPIAYWLDPSGRLNHARVDAHMAPCREERDCPLILRISINYLALDHHQAIIRRMGWESEYKGGYGSSVGWAYELTVLPEQILDFVPWIASLAVAHAAHDESRLLPTPHACHLWGRPGLSRCYAWTQAAWDATETIRQRWQREWRRRHGLLTRQSGTEPAPEKT